MASNPATQAQIPIRSQGQNECPDHQAEVVFYCKDCGGQLICLKCATTSHQGHTFDNVSDVAVEKKWKIQDYIRKAEKTELPQIEHKIESIDKKIKEKTKHEQLLTQEIQSKREKLKTEIDEIIEEFVKTCRQVEQHNRDRLSKYKQELQAVYTQLSQRVDKWKETIDSGNNITVIDVEKEIYKESHETLSPALQIVEFSERQCPTSLLENAVGTLSVQTEKELTDGRVKQFRSNDSKIITDFKHSTNITSIEKSNTVSVCVSCKNDKYVSFLTLKGKVKQTVKAASNVRDISVSPVTGKLWFCCWDQTIYEVSSKTPSQRFTADSHLLRLCVTLDNTLVVLTVDYIVIVYNTTGKVLHTTHGTGNSLATTPCNVTVNNSTGDIAVCDSDWSDYGGRDKPHVTVFTNKLNIKHRYCGLRKAMKFRFNPWDAVYDSKGQLPIADFDNMCIQLVSGEGQFLTVLYTDSVHPRSLTLIQDGLLCVGFDCKTIKVIQYKE